MSDLQENEVPVPEVVTGAEEVNKSLPGALLAAKRQAKGWSVEHVASQLKFAARQVVALEADNYGALPGPVIVRGFVRAYAKLLGLESASLVAALPQDGTPPVTHIAPQRTLSTPFSESPLPLGNRKKLPVGILVGGALIVVIAGLALVIHRTELFDGVPQLAWLKPGDKPAVVEDSAPPSSTEEQAQADPAEPSPEVQDSTDKDKQDKLDADANKTASMASQSSPPAVKPAESAPAKVSAPVSAAVAATSRPTKPADEAESATKPAQAVAAQAAGGSINISNSKDLLRLNFHEDSWVEIRRADKSVVISRLLKAGTSEAFDITEPVTVVIGNVAGVDASLRGSKLDIQSDSSNNVARLSLK
ncbi:cytoskeleton protein RodZ [Herbaspirillum sp. Sphag1AN]|uniref:helix-turn-helix domain-containing protein n=1 Tax=unclassified Herbaspirillum TaxID=2624150 RepID=UPI00161CB8D5|nr:MULTISPECIES: helix-turn-helix domain-containing protein [unclassified Herbaspirillum]MBB3210908.1 cytoskeleton protein RodZ [Herbaspirillum sp. Sphag1AN]MBB3244538.1 cytoskeleton protein RodZ [Herbaspirillum sp. Sphag64]